MLHKVILPGNALPFVTSLPASTSDSLQFHCSSNGTVISQHLARQSGDNLGTWKSDYLWHKSFTSFRLTSACAQPRDYSLISFFISWWLALFHSDVIILQYHVIFKLQINRNYNYLWLQLGWLLTKVYYTQVAFQPKLATLSPISICIKISNFSEYRFSQFIQSFYHCLT